MKHHEQPATDGGAERRGTLASMCLALVLVVASVSSVNLALTGISLDLGTSSSQLMWIADGYTVALAALVLPFGALGDRVGRRSLLLFGTVIFGLAALTASASQGPETLIACRVVMGIGAAMIMPATLSTITAVFPPAQRARAVSVWAGFATSGAILGMLGCGLLLEWSSWRATFVATAVLAAAAFVAALKLAPNTKDPDEAVIDLPGFVLSAIGIGALIYGIVEGAEAGWTTGTAVVGMAVSASALFAFVAVGAAGAEADARRPAVRPPGLQHRHAGPDRPVPLPLRLLLRRAPVPAAHPRVQRPGKCSRVAPDGRRSSCRCRRWRHGSSTASANDR